MFSCSKENIIRENSISLDLKEIESVGILHNEYVSKVYSSVDFTKCSNCEERILQEFSSLNFDITGLPTSKEELISAAFTLYNSQRNHNFNLKSWNPEMLGEQGFELYENIGKTIEEANSVEELISTIEGIQVSLKGKVNQQEYEILMVSMEVAKNSYMLWAPRSIGGLDYYSIPRKHRLSSRRWSWKNAVASDVGAAAGYFFSLAGVLAVTSAAPPANAAIAVGIAISSGVASALGGIN